jgi:Chaperone of endosialidase
MYHQDSSACRVPHARKAKRLFTLILLAFTASGVTDTFAQSWSPNPQVANQFNVGGAVTYRLGRATIGRNLFAAFPNNSQLEVFGGAMAQVQTGLYGNFTAADQWAGIGQNPTVAGIYGVGMFRTNKYAFYNLFDNTRNALATKDLIVGFGTTTAAADPNQRMLIRSFTGNAANPFSHFSVDPALRAIGINTENPTSTLFIDAANSNTAFRSAFLLNAGNPTANFAAATFTAIGQEGNSTINAQIFGLRTQVGNGTNGFVAANFNVDATNVAGPQEGNITWQDLNYGGLVANAGTTQDKFNFYFRNNVVANPTSLNNRRRVMALLANGRVGINTGVADPISFAFVLGPPAAIVPINLDVPNAGIRTQFVFLSSDQRLKKAIAPIADPLKKVLNLKGRSYIFKGQNDDQETPTFGFVAQEVEGVVPELTVTAEDSARYKAVNYDGVVAILVEAMKEQQCQIDALTTWARQVSQTLGIPLPLCDVAVPVSPTSIDGTKAQPVPVTEAKENANTRILQNRPNPSDGNTDIYYEFNDNGTAQLTIVDLQGRVRKTYNSLAKGLNKISLRGGELEAGTYIYSILVNGKPIDTKRMVIVR